jgi:hypothetical protein
MLSGRAMQLLKLGILMVICVFIGDFFREPDDAGHHHWGHYVCRHYAVGVAE